MALFSKMYFEMISQETGLKSGVVLLRIVVEDSEQLLFTEMGCNIPYLFGKQIKANI